MTPWERATTAVQCVARYVFDDWLSTRDEISKCPRALNVYFPDNSGSTNHVVSVTGRYIEVHGRTPQSSQAPLK